MVEVVLSTLINKIKAKFDIWVLRPIDWRYWKLAAFGSAQMDTRQVEALTAKLGYSFKNEQDKAFFEHRFSGYEVIIPDATLDAGNGWVISGRQIHPLSFFNINDPYDGRKRYPSVLRFKLAKLLARFTREDDVVWMPKLWNNYYHFVVELLPVLLSLKRSGQSATVLGCAETEYPYVQYFADRLQLNDYIRFQAIDKSRFYKARLVRLKKRPIFEPEFLNDLHAFVQDQFPHELSHARDKVFIYRKGMRSLQNNTDVLEMLQERGFFCFDPGDHPVDFQVAALTQATVVVGVHGAGLTNIIFSARLQLVIELMPGNMKPNHYREIAMEKRAGYICLTGSPLDNKGQFSIDANNLLEEIARNN